MDSIKLNLFCIILFFLHLSYSQNNADIGLPNTSSFQVDKDIQGTIQNSVNEVTGKIAFSVPLASISSGSTGFQLSLGYNGQASFKNGQQTNKYNPTSIVGVGWNMSTPKIVVDTKQTATRDDDDFYLNGVKLIAINKNEAPYPAVGYSYWEFQLENYQPWKIKYKTSFSDRIFGGPQDGQIITTKLDYWEIIDEKGIKYTYGLGNSKESQIAWSNWIGDSNQSGGELHTIAWNLSSIEDQWQNRLTFQYEHQENRMKGTSLKQTEAAYLKKVISSNGANIVLTYANKNTDEYYEPHTEISEPDAYQERYEKKYLQNVKIFNNNNQLRTTHNLVYSLNGSGLNKKRYLTQISQVNTNNNQSSSLPSQKFEYHYSGLFKGGLKKVTYPTGGSVSYNYTNKLLFHNTSQRFTRPVNFPSGYQSYGITTKDNYTLLVLKSKNAVSGDKYRFKIYRFWWNGEKWDWNEYTFPHLMKYDSGNIYNSLVDFFSVYSEDFYGFAYQVGGTGRINMYLFHLSKDKRSWKFYQHTSLNLGGDNPTFMSGNDFVGLGAHRTGKLLLYNWNGTSWNFKQINQGSGQYYYGATNNYIISLDEDGGYDMGTTSSYADNYYFHYLDAEKKWQTKLWTQKMFQKGVRATDDPSYFYPDNSICGFVADNNSEFFLRWDDEYNLTNVDNVLGAYNDASPMVPIANNMFTIYNGFYKMPYKSARFNGVNWKTINVQPSSMNYSRMNFGYNLMTFENHKSYNNGNAVAYVKFDNNYNTWRNYTLSTYSKWQGSPKVSGVNRDFVIAGNKIFKNINNNFTQLGTLQYDNNFTNTDGLNHAFVDQTHIIDNGSWAGHDQRNNLYYFIDKNTGNLSNLNVGNKGRTTSVPKFGGFTPFMAPKSLWLSESISNRKNYYPYRLINDKFNQPVYDVVVGYVDINDNNGNSKKIQYTYNEPKSTPDNQSTFYKEVIIENKGYGIGSIGKVKKVFNNGESDLSMAGLPLQVLIFDSNDNIKSKKTIVWNKYLKSAHNGSTTVDWSYYIRILRQKEESYLEGSSPITSETRNNYNSYGLKTATYITNSEGENNSEEIVYAYSTYNFLKNKNMLSFPYQLRKKVNGQILGVNQTKWINANGRAYISEKLSGPDLNKLRINSKISKVDNEGNILEINNGRGIYNSVLFSHNHLYEVAAISNAKYSDVLNALDLSYTQIQTMSNSVLESELLKLYDRLPNSEITLTFFDDNGRVVKKINNRKEETNIYYDVHNRIDYITDSSGKILEKKEYHIGN